MTVGSKKEENYYISRRHLRLDFPKDLSIDDKILIYEDRINGWFIEVVQSLEPNVATDFVSLMTITALWEAHGVLLRGGRHKKRILEEGKTKKVKDSAKDFKAGFKRFLRFVLPTAKHEWVGKITDTIYRKVRCGLFHAATTRGIRVSRDNPNKPLSFEVSVGQDLTVTFNVPRLADAAHSYFRQYIAQLRNPTNDGHRRLRNNFESGWKDIDLLAEGR